MRKSYLKSLLRLINLEYVNFGNFVLKLARGQNELTIPAYQNEIDGWSFPLCETVLIMNETFRL